MVACGIYISFESEQVNFLNQIFQGKWIKRKIWYDDKFILNNKDYCFFSHPQISLIILIGGQIEMGSGGEISNAAFYFGVQSII